jgi:hypothetical protein
MSGSTSDESQSSGDLVDEAAAAAPQSIGTYLAAQRRLRGISIEELSQQTRIPLRSLERLEAGSFDTDVDGFVRGFVRTVAEALGLDPDEALNRTLPEPGSPAGRGVAPQLSVRRVVATVLGILLLGGAGLAVQMVAVSFKGDASRPGSGAQIVVRRDPVRALAEAQGIAALPPAPALALAASQAAVSGTRSPDLAVPGELEPPARPPLALPSTP